MSRGDRRFHLAVTGPARFDQHRHFRFGGNPPFPAIHRNGLAQHVDASGQALVNERLGEPESARAIGEIGEDDQSVDGGFGHGVLPRALKTVRRAE
ncbi:hypothetical protein D3C83_00810 [compost metagenome]